MPKRYGMVIDLERCVGCHTCTVACMMEHDLTAAAGIVVQTIGGEDRDTPSGKHPDLHMHFLPILCAQCANAPCIENCPSGAIQRREDGIVFIDSAACDSCLNCTFSCPYQAIFHDEKTETLWKCNLCKDRLDRGEEPFCVICCEGEALVFGDLNDPNSDVARMISDRGGQALLAETAPAVWYCPTKQGRIR